MHKTVFRQKVPSHIFVSQTLLCLFIVLLYILTCPLHAAESTSDPAIALFQGNTMGTTYHIKVVMHKGDDKKEWSDSNKKSLHSLIEDRLKEVNQSMSVYSKSSEISLFNNARQGEIVKISPEFYFVMLTSQKLYKMTDGAWDGTVKPLVDLWGFGTKDQITAIPSSDNIRAILENIGFDQISIQDRTLKKQNSAITLDLGSIAKGFGVDAIGQLLKEQGYTNFLVEIGGEVIASGKKMEGVPWMVGISRPDKGGDPNDIYSSLQLQDRALATSGDYRNFVIIEGKTYSHIIDPATGYPVTNGVVSTSVVAESCTFADGLATALMVMGQEKGIKLVNSLENTECLILVRDDKGNLKDYRSAKFPLP